MFTHRTSLRVRYSETDRMGYVYYGNYAMYYEAGRVEALRALGMSYREMEDTGIMLPVIKLEVNYLKPAFYDDLITVETSIPLLPDVKIKFDYLCINPNNEIINKGHTTLVFINKENGRPCRAPQELIKQLQPYFN
jgi:acyl-CoA thioester hydrolase